MSREFYDELHGKYFPLERTDGIVGRHRMSRCLSLIRKCNPASMLEIGFENPHRAKSLVDTFPNTRYVGVDISQASVKAARDMGVSAFVVDVSSEKLPVPSQSFDLVYCAEVIEHLLDPDFAMKEFSRILKPEGKILLTTPNLASWYNRIVLLLGIQPLHTEVSTSRILGRRFRSFGQGNRPVGHLRIFTLGALLDFLSLHGLQTLLIEGYRLELLDRLWALEAIMSKITSVASGFIVLAKKTRP